ncbi:uroporphyrinogen decarboxylase family protein [Fontisphaera persica]|uniref:uroporphyrinogen decarboxylase family protein n=1 Tax=Fontisphaera persica TaxID=2974023 RepID=UPI0024C04EE5|nr:uroporphyrinogen decarboxylase family protein [Fontisphaera persica]WCJ60164.1 uroporphyrinogen decarboxylase family protein [Fontisphaera persica]
MMNLPFTPAVYEHAARFVGRTPWEVSRNPELLYAGHRAAWLTYHHTPVVVGIDIYNLEAEAYGAHITVPEGNGIPAIHEPLVDSVEAGLALPPFDPQRDGRLPMVIAVAQRLKRDLPEADVRLPVAGPFSVAFNLRGIQNLCEDVALRPQLTARWLMQLADNQARFCRAIAAAGLDIAFFESAAAPPLLSPRQFREIELPALQRILSLAADIVGHPVPCIMGGDTFRIYDELMSTGTHFVVCNVETNQAAFVARAKVEHPHVRIRVNMDAAIVACDQPERIYREIDRIVALTAGHPNCLLGTGCLPYETPPGNVQLIKDYLASLS